MFRHDVIKINYIRQGYLPDKPYYLISDNEMFDAFIQIAKKNEDSPYQLSEECFFALTYPLVEDSLYEEYNALIDEIVDRITQFKEKGTEIPAWVYSYMLGEVISVNSPEIDIDYLYDLLNLGDSTNVIVASEFSPEMSIQCYKVSKAWLQKAASSSADRVPTMFGEPHVIKSLRLSKVNVLDN